MVSVRLEWCKYGNGTTYGWCPFRYTFIEPFYMLEAIRQHIDDMEDLYLAEQRLLDVRSGRSVTHSIDDVERSLGLAD